MLGHGNQQCAQKCLANAKQPRKTHHFVGQEIVLSEYISKVRSVHELADASKQPNTCQQEHKSVVKPASMQRAFDRARNGHSFVPCNYA